MTAKNVIIIVLKHNLDGLMLTRSSFSPISYTSGVEGNGFRFCQLFRNSNEKGMTGKAAKNEIGKLAK